MTREIRCYVSPTGRDAIQSWYDALEPIERADMDQFIRYVRRLRDWEMPQYRPNLTNFPKLGELRWKSNRKQFRLIGFFRNSVFIALVGCTHKQQIYKPPDALRTADDRRKKIEAGEADTCEYEI